MKENNKELKDLNIKEKLLKTDLDFSSDSEHNLDLANSIGLLYSLENFNKSLNIPKRMIKSIVFLSNTNNVMKEIMLDYSNSLLHSKGKRGKNWLRIIRDLTKSNWKRKDLENEKRFNRFSVR